MIYLDTHVVVWVHANDRQRFSVSLQQLMNQHEWFISPIVRLELQYLHEIGRINPTVDTILTDVAQRMGLSVCSKPFNNIIANALSMTWTRDPFDRILVAHASIDNDILITRDEMIRDHYSQARW
ncbi:MAG: PIN domain-containing protein [Chloroflexota bacterium]